MDALEFERDHLSLAVRDVPEALPHHVDNAVVDLRVWEREAGQAVDECD